MCTNSPSRVTERGKGVKEAKGSRRQRKEAKGAGGGGIDRLSLAYFWSSWGKTYLIHGSGKADVDKPFHSLQNYTSNYPVCTPEARRKVTLNTFWTDPVKCQKRTSRKFDTSPKDVYDEEKDNYDHTFICHSQGCNIAMHLLHVLCGETRQHALGKLNGDGPNDYYKR